MSHLFKKLSRDERSFTCKPEWSTQAIFMCQMLRENSYLLVLTRKTGQFLCGKYIHWKPSVLAFISQILVIQRFLVVYHGLYNNLMSARAVIDRSAMLYCASKLMEISRVLWIIT